MKNFAKLFLTTLLTLAIHCQVNAAEIKFVQVADAHYTASGNPYREEVLKSTIQSINDLKGVSFVVFTGDNINSPKPEDLEKFLNIVDDLKVPYYLVIGNHDVFKGGGLSKEKYFEIVRMTNPFYFFKKPNYTFKKNGFFFIVVDGAKEVIPGTNGYFKDATLTWLDKKLTEHKDEPIVILQHFPINEPSQIRSHKTVYPEKYFEILDKHENVIAVISGHYHINHEEMRNGVYHITSPTLLRNPPVYKIIDIVTTKEFSPMVYTQLKDVEIKK